MAANQEQSNHQVNQRSSDCDKTTLEFNHTNVFFRPNLILLSRPGDCQMDIINIW